MQDIFRSSFRDAPLKRKLVLLSTASSLVALVMAGTALIAVDIVGQRETIRQDLSTLSEVIGRNCSAALLFDDQKAAGETLGALGAKREIVAAAIYDRAGRRFATFSRSPEELAVPDRAESDGHRAEGGHLVMINPIKLQEDRIGTIHFLYDLKELNHRLVLDLAVVALILVISFFISSYLSNGLRRMTSEPILHLAEIARQVRARNDYSLRASWQSGDEIGVLIGDFNRMLAEVEKRDEQKSQAERKFAFLAEASRLLARSMDYKANLAEALKLAIPYLCDECVVELFPGLESRARFRIGGKEETEEPREVQEARLAAQAGNSAQVIHTRTRSTLVVPLVARDRALGMLTFSSRDGAGRYGAEEMQVAEDLARRAADAVDNACLYKDAQDAVQLRDDFISIASHELKTPVTILQLQVQTVLNSALAGTLASLPERKVRDMKHAADRQIQRFLRLIHDLLDVSKLASHKTKLELEDTELSEIVLATTRELSAEAERAGCELRVELDEGLFGKWDRFRLEQVLMNLLTNAMKYGAGKPVLVRTSRTPSGARVSVRDLGIGIAKEDQGRIFQRFERAVSLRHFGGFGLGLFIAQQAIVAHGGRIWVESEPGQGSVFHFEIPLAPQQDAGRIMA